MDSEETNYTLKATLVETIMVQWKDNNSTYWALHIPRWDGPTP
jgi:hypothetical protein